ncbi:hypothetical protein CBM2588_A150003 [Cupriavidus taiwanensis]|nr:hypothetical protein CBM2588_A150003 [Cupriavidus taiwanensis]SOZ56180.1 hypothetical protein CBM2617_A200003 [Cupriavidus taiwanensis]SOZ78788.1 hypothetical protein CBM2618_A180003 [Cupriavidus taiwanensis]SOZ79052.1 hypothetical protein CBM2622_A170003 [Cupriavidus taiwanensis]SOZ86274.1 hypothetical protein CBM2621_A170003 [Cupriavidus taiwanensis]
MVRPWPGLQPELRPRLQRSRPRTWLQWALPARQIQSTLPRRQLPSILPVPRLPLKRPGLSKTAGADMTRSPSGRYPSLSSRSPSVGSVNTATTDACTTGFTNGGIRVAHRLSDGKLHLTKSVRIALLPEHPVIAIGRQTAAVPEKHAFADSA